MRKSHVFVSSRLKLGKIRMEIKQILEECGFSAEIYESDSTPATELATYLQDITQADFVVFVLDETYGTPRPSSGRSGVHEECMRVRDHGIPNHVYLKRPKGVHPDRQQKRFIESELIAREVSYYYYASTADLLQRVRCSIAKLAIDIARSHRYRRTLDALSVVADVVEHDHEAVCQWERSLTQLLQYDDRLSSSYVTDAWGQVSDIFEHFNPEGTMPFLDGKVQDLFSLFLKAITSLARYYSDHTDPAPANFADGGTLQLPVGSLGVATCKVIRWLPDDFLERRNALKTDIQQEWKTLADLVRRRYVKYRDL
jgi:hypothetical protein